MKKTMYNKTEKIITLIFYFWIIWFTAYFISCFFVYTYYITFYIILTDIYLLSRCIVKSKFTNEVIKGYLERVMIVIPILLLQLPISGILFFYRMHKGWMNIIIIVIFFFLLLLLLTLLYYFNFTVTLWIIIISVTIPFFIFN
jgi:hypothetical protein